MKNKFLIVIWMVCGFFCSISVKAQTVEELNEKVRVLEEKVNALITENQARDTAYESKFNTTKQEMTAQQQSFQNTINGSIESISNSQTQLRSEITSDLANTKTNLTKLVSDNSPVGTVLGFLGSQPEFLPVNWKLCDGSNVTRNEFPKLFEVMNFTGESAALPDLSGQFLRGIDVNNNTVRDDPDGKRRPGNVQPDMFQSHKHIDSGHGHSASASGSVTIPDTFGEMTDCGDSCNVNGNEGIRDVSKTVSVSVSIGSGNANITNPVESDQGVPRIGVETRPKNVAVYWVIKVK